jgi:hypothetical protein
LKEQLVTYRTHRLGAASPPGWGHIPGWSPLVDDGPAPLQAARSVGRWLWPTLAVGGFVVVAGFVLAHDDAAPGVSGRGLLTIALAAAVVILLTLHRRYGPRPLARALFEYAVVFLLAVLVATTGVDLDQAPTAGTRASTLPDQRPALVKTIDSFRDWLGEWRDWAHKENRRRNRPTSTTTPGPTGDAMAPPSPAMPASTRRLL